jgi:hypothetical protein
MTCTICIRPHNALRVNDVSSALKHYVAPHYPYSEAKSMKLGD